MDLQVLKGADVVYDVRFDARCKFYRFNIIFFQNVKLKIKKINLIISMFIFWLIRTIIINLIFNQSLKTIIINFKVKL